MNHSDLLPCGIHVDKDGRMFFQGAEMLRPEINELLLRHVGLDDQGRWVLEYQGQKCLLEAAATAVVVRRAEYIADGTARVVLTLSDGAAEDLNPNHLWIGPDEAFYTRIRNGTMPARFLRPAHWQLAQRAVALKEGFGLDLGGRIWPIRTGGHDGAGD